MSSKLNVDTLGISMHWVVPQCVQVTSPTSIRNHCVIQCHVDSAMNNMKTHIKVLICYASAYCAARVYVTLYILHSVTQCMILLAEVDVVPYFVFNKLLHIQCSMYVCLTPLQTFRI